MTNRILVPLAVAMAGLTSAAPAAPRPAKAPALVRAGRPFLSIEIIATRAELIVVARATAAARPGDVELKLVDKTRYRGRYLEYTLRVDSVLKQIATEGVKPLAAGGSIRVLTSAPPVPPKSAPPEMLKMLRELFPELALNQSYLLVLSKVSGQDVWLLQPFPGYYQPATAQAVRKMKRAVAIDGWPWGAARDGLRLALLPQGPAELARGGLAMVRVVLAVRNVAKEDVTLNLYRPDKPLAIKARGPQGRRLVHDFYKSLAVERIGTFGPAHTVKIKAGQVGFIGPRPQDRLAVRFAMPLSVGIWQIQAFYKSARVREADESAPGLWAGQIASQPAAIEVRKFKRTSGPPTGLGRAPTHVPVPAP